jgi:quinol monooxygenase YgiN
LTDYLPDKSKYLYRKDLINGRPTLYLRNRITHQRLSGITNFPLFQSGGTMNDTAAYVSTFQAKEGSERLLEHELQRLVSFTRRERACLFCDLFRLSKDKTVFVVHSVWSSREVWLSREGWENHPAGIGLLDQCLSRPVEVVAMEAMEEVA